MIRAVLAMAAALAAAMLLPGCQGQVDPEDSAIPAPQTVLFRGDVDIKFAGTWKTNDGGSIVRLAKDGGLGVETIAQTASGKSDVKVSGQWLVKNGNLIFRYTDKSKNPVVIEYKASLDGNTMKLEQGGGRLKSTYTRQKL